MEYPTAAQSAAGTAGDAAFGSAPQQNPESVKALVMELQTILNMKGYGPLVVTGEFDAATKAATERVAGAGATINRAIELLKAPPVGEGPLNPPVVPWYKQPKYLMAGAAVLGVVGYIAYRTGALDGVLGAMDLDDEEDEGPGQKLTRVPKAGSTRRPAKPPREKCAVLPDIDSGEDLKPPEPS